MLRHASNFSAARAGEQASAAGQFRTGERKGRALAAAALLVGAVPATTAQAQRVTPSVPAAGATLQQLAKSVRNPFEKFITRPVQSATGFAVGPHHNAGENLNVEPVRTFSLSAEWKLHRAGGQLQPRKRMVCRLRSGNHAQPGCGCGQRMDGALSNRVVEPIVFFCFTPPRARPAAIGRRSDFTLGSSCLF